jgi:hypothetical protein
MLGCPWQAERRHRHDACELTQAHETVHILRGLAQAPIKKLMVVEGGQNPSGNPCQALHWHGFIGMEERAVQDIAAWMREPRP